MTAYLIRRILYAVPVIVGVNLITFVLFFAITPPETMAYQILGEKNTTQADIRNWLAERGYDRPLLWNPQASGWAKLTDTIFFKKTVPLFWFDFGASDQDRRMIGTEIRRRMGPSLLIATPTFLAGLLVNILVAMTVAYYRGTYLDTGVVVICVALMSISVLFYIIAVQYAMGRLWHLFPISGYDTGLFALKFTAMPVLIGVIAGIGGGVRYYRTLFLEEVQKDYVRTARAKGLPESRVLFVHALKNALIPILTTVVMSIPFLFMGSLLMENFFAIPGLGSYTIDAIQAKDFAIVRAMVFLGSVLYIVGLLLTDISYTLVDPRVRLE
ncbi:MAG: peptide ABC transporter permease [Candidatus Poribacteria bacterium]|nr:MAG: peptide ABC transporter permease [Candidatus Poribacteria bacterium]